MIQVQVEYQKLLEQQRHNLEDEAIRWANVQIEKFKALEQQRHNLTTEQQAQLELAEKIRHNLVSEKQADKNLAIEMFTAQTKAGELALKEAVEPIKAKASMLSGIGAMNRGSAALQEIPIKQQQANTSSYKAYQDVINTRNRNITESRKADTSAKSAEYTYETSKERNVIEADKSRWGEEAAKAKALNDAGRNLTQAAPIYMQMMGQ